MGFNSGLKGLTVAGTVFRNIKRDNSDPIDNTNPSRHLIKKFITTFLRISWNSDTTYETDKIVKHLRLNTHLGMMKSPYVS